MSKHSEEQTNKKWFDFKNIGSDEPVLSIFDEIGGWGTWADEVIAQLDAITAPQIKVRLFSPGGYIDEGMQIYNALRRHDARIVIEIDAQAASIASVIAMAGDEIRMADTAFMMIHDPWSGVMGNAEDMRKQADVLDKLKKAIVLAYVKRTGLDASNVEEMMAEETWMSAAEAVDLGFADKVDAFESAEPRDCFSNRIVNAFNRVPESLRGMFAVIQEHAQPVLMLSPTAMKGVNNQSAAAGEKAGAMPERKYMEVIMKDNGTAAPVDVAAIEKTTTENNLARVSEIGARADRAHDLVGRDKAQAMARAAIESGASVNEFADLLMAAAQAKASEQRSPIGMSDNEVESFSLHRALLAAATGDWSEAGFEQDVVTATANKLGSIYKKGIAIPTDVLLSRGRNVVTSTVAAPTIQTDVSLSFIDILRNKMRVREAGATVLDGLQGNQSISRLTGSATAQWVAEGVAATLSDQSYDAVTLAPKGVAATTRITLQSMMQSSIGLEMLTQRDLATVIALAADQAAINGSGTGATPRGILNTAGIGSVALGTNGALLADVDAFVDLETLVSESNADEGSLRYMTNAKVVGALKKLKTSTGEYLFSSSDRELPTALGQVNSYDVLRSNQIPSNLVKGTSGSVCSAAIFGDWSSLLIGEWGALILDVEKVQGNPGLFNVNALQFMDMAVRHPEAFAAITDIKTA